MRTAFLLCLILIPAFADEIAVDFDSGKTTVQFTLGATLHTVHGTFRLKRGSIDFHPDSEKISGELVIEAASGRSGNDDRDRTMHEKILESAKYSEIAFMPNRIEGSIANSGSSSIQVHGVIRLHGTEHEITIPVTAQLAEKEAVIDTKFSVPYVKWGLKNPSNLLLRVSDQVEIVIHAVGEIRSRDAVTGRAN